MREFQTAILGVAVFFGRMSILGLEDSASSPARGPRIGITAASQRRTLQIAALVN
jgi:hypothetical protein